MNSKQQDVQAILKLYELRRDEAMRKARAWYVTEFNPESAADIIKTLVSGQQESAYYRMVTSYWDMAASLVNNGGIDEQMFLEANTEHLGIFAKIEPFIAEVRETIGEQDYLAHIERLVLKVPNAREIMANRRRLFSRWAKAKSAAADAGGQS
ncbi:MAG TPA: hypothetical protein VFD58_34855 [Blastocatellia bacterium]|nr:hypothetical protein [Blastocatellia bacterium]